MQVNLEIIPDILSSVPEDYLVTMMSPAGFQWSSGDATIPDKWQVATRRTQDNVRRDIFLSPARQIFASREKVAEHLLAGGWKLARIAGYKEPAPALNCLETCEGRCSNFLIASSFYSANDPNHFRKKAKIRFFADFEIKDKIRDKTPRNLDRTVYNPETLTYGHPIIRSERPWILFIDEDEPESISPVADSRVGNQLSKEPQSSTTSSLKRKRPVNLNESRPAKRMKRPEKVPVRPRSEEGRQDKRKVRGGGTDTALYVQCCNKSCATWRQVKEYTDGAQVPDYWVCSMNRDAMNRVCGKGGNHFSGTEVKIKYPRGTLVWGKLKGYPWWPGMIDYNPDSDEFFWIDEKISKTDPARYNIIFFERENDVSSAWVRTEDIRADQDQSPATNVVLSQEVRDNLAQSMVIFGEARKLSVENRLNKFSIFNRSLKPKPTTINSAPEVKATKSTPEKEHEAEEASTSTKCSEKRPEPRLVETELIKPEQLYSKCNPSWEKTYNKPPLPSDVLITLAVRNLDPENHSGASFSSIVAFLTLHFPYFNRNIEECKDMVRKAYDIESKVRDP